MCLDGAASGARPEERSRIHLIPGRDHTFLSVWCLAVYYLLLLSVKKNDKLEEEGTFHSIP